jgi:CopG family transcriptional regulator/antitoxin EndoAI
MISLPETLLEEVDGLVAAENRNRSELIREAMHLYLQEIKRQQIRERLKQGYLEMAETNLGLAREALAAENDADRFWRSEQTVGGRKS